MQQVDVHIQGALTLSCFALCPTLLFSCQQRLPAFREPDLRWWQTRRVAAAGASSRQELAVLEQRLTLEEVAHFRHASTDRCSACCLWLSSHAKLIFASSSVA